MRAAVREFAIGVATSSASRLIESEDQVGIAGPPVAVDLGSAADPLGSLKQLPPQVELSRLPGGQRGLDVGPRLERRGELPGSGRGVGGPGRGMRPNHEGGIAEKADAAERHPRGLPVHDHLDERLGGGEHHLSEASWKAGAGRGLQLRDVLRPGGPGWKRDLVAVAVAVGHQVIELAALKVVPVPDEVDQSLPRPDRAIGSWYGIDEDVAVGINVIGDGINESLGLCPQLPLGDEATPGHVAGIYRLGSGEETGAGVGPDSIGTNHEIDVKVGLVRKDDVHSPVSLLKANHLMAQQVSLAAKTSQQRSIDGVPGGETIR